MGHKHSYNIIPAFIALRSAARECSDPRTDGYIAWGVKQDLYQLKWAVDSFLKDCPTFGPEQEWLRDQEQLKIIKLLKDEN
jgi:hypothetical protein